MLCLTVEHDGRTRRQRFPEHPIRIGSDADNDIVIASKFVSRRHAIIQRRPDGFEVRDLGSLNGTWIAGRRILADHRLSLPITLKLGSDIHLRLSSEETEDFELALPVAGYPESPGDASPGACTLSSDNQRTIRERITEEPPGSGSRPRWITSAETFRPSVLGGSVIDGGSPAIQRLHVRMAAAVTSGLPVLITGETGVGKEIYARALHLCSHRGRGPFSAINSAAIPSTLLESTLFGAEDGAATGVRRQKGLLRETEGGTFFLDEIGEMSLELQAKLLRALDEKRVLPLGGARTVAIDVRFVAATNRHLTTLIAEGRFRADLYYRLNGHSFEIPPLRHRHEDIPDYIQRFLTDECSRYGRRAPGVTHKAMNVLRAYRWPGNVRELESLVRRLVHELPDGRPIDFASLPPELRETATSPQPAGTSTPLAQRIADIQRKMIVEALVACSGNKSQAAEALGLSRGGLRALTNRLGISEGS